MIAATITQKQVPGETDLVVCQKWRASGINCV